MRLNSWVRIAVWLGTIGVVFAGCGAIHNAQQSAATGFHSGFRSSFKSSFMKSCTAQVGTTETLCGCIESTLERENTDDELIKMTADAPETSKKLGEAARACRSGSAQPAMDPARITAYVTPYYDSNGPSIQVGAFSSELASSNPKQVFATTAQMKRQWQRLSFPQLYVGAIRLYDLGYRNEAVYWFYTAQYRARQVSVLLDPAKIGNVGDPGFELQAAGSAFMQTAGTWINGYAFGNPNRLIATVRRVQREGRRIGDLHAIYPSVAFIDRRRWPAANTQLADGMDSLVTYLERNKDQIARQRAANGTAAKFSHLTSK
ncbi:MAG: hypothetical protein WCE97_03065 [Candidatus Cybelea sp.]